MCCDCGKGTRIQSGNGIGIHYKIVIHINSTTNYEVRLKRGIRFHSGKQHVFHWMHSIPIGSIGQFDCHWSLFCWLQWIPFSSFVSNNFLWFPLTSFVLSAVFTFELFNCWAVVMIPDAWSAPGKIHFECVISGSGGEKVKSVNNYQLSEVTFATFWVENVNIFLHPWKINGFPGLGLPCPALPSTGRAQAQCSSNWTFPLLSSSFFERKKRKPLVSLVFSTSKIF